MVIEISLAVIAIALVTLVGYLIALGLQVRKTISHIQTDIHLLSLEISNLIGSVDELTTDLTKKSQSLNFLFAPLNHMNSTEEATSQNNTFPQFVEWAATSLVLFKKSKEFIKKYVK
jgi:uncharacterized protein YoxC